MLTILVIVFCSVVLIVDFCPLYKAGKRKEALLYGILYTFSAVVLLLSSLEMPIPHFWNLFVH